MFSGRRELRPHAVRIAGGIALPRFTFLGAGAVFLLLGSPEVDSPVLAPERFQQGLGLCRGDLSIASLWLFLFFVILLSVFAIHRNVLQFAAFFLLGIFLLLRGRRFAVLRLFLFTLVGFLRFSVLILVL